MQKLEKLFVFPPPTLKKLDYELGRPVVLMVYASFIGIWWAVGQNGEDRNKFVVRFGVKVLNYHQHGYTQVNKELWVVVIALKNENEYLIGVTMVMETDCLPLLELIISCYTPNLTMLM